LSDSVLYNEVKTGEKTASASLKRQMEMLFNINPLKEFASSIKKSLTL